MILRLYIKTFLFATFLSLPIIICVNNSFARSFIFSPEVCEFSVSFPVKYKSKILLKDGLEGSAASANVRGLASIQAECWPSDHNISINAYAKGVEHESRKMGIAVDSVIIDRDVKVGKQVVLSGRIQLDNQQVYMKMISTFGRNTRLDLLILDDKIVSQIQLNFRNSIKRK